MTEKEELEFEMEEEYDFSNAMPNPYSRYAKEKAALAVILDADVAKTYTTAEAVNKALRSVLKQDGA
jgi:hypothetical protein